MGNTLEACCGSREEGYENLKDMSNMCTTEHLTEHDNDLVKISIMSNVCGMSVVILNYGASLWSVKVSTGDKKKKEKHELTVSAGNDTLNKDGFKKFLDEFNYNGSTCGRVANRIAGGTFTLDGNTITLPVNNGPNCLHGGVKSWSHRVWDMKTYEEGDFSITTLTLVSESGDEGFPGTVTATAIYKLHKTKNELHTSYEAVSDSTTVVNMTNHAYWNLSGNVDTKILSHQLKLPHCKSVLRTDKNSIPVEENEVEHTAFNFLNFKAIGSRLHTLQANYDWFGQQGYDHCFIHDSNRKLGVEHDKPALMAILRDPETHREMKVHSTTPGVQLYTANWFNGENQFSKHGGVALETQHFPDSPNHPNYPSITLNEGEKYKVTTNYSFGFYTDEA